jgi:uncharacterized protein YybS (DUF2232 family)
MSLRRPAPGSGSRAAAAVPGKPPDRSRTRGLTEGAILAALTAIVAAAGLVIPFIGLVLAPLPIMLLVIRWGLRMGVLAAIVAGLILLQFFGPLTAFSVVAFAPIGLALGWAVQRNLGATRTILAGAIALSASSLAGLSMARFVLHQDVLNQMLDMMIKSEVEGLRISLAAMERMGTVPPERLREMQSTIDTFPNFLSTLVHTLLPVLAALAMLMWTYFCYLAARAVLRRVGHPIPALPPMRRWRASVGLASVLLYSAAGLSLASRWLPLLGVPALNVVWLNLFLFGFLGTLVAATWMDRWRVPRLMQLVAGVLLLQSGFLPLLALAIVGLLDTWYDYRHLLQRLPPAATGNSGEPETDQSQSTQAVKAVHPQ